MSQESQLRDSNTHWPKEGPKIFQPMSVSVSVSSSLMRICMSQDMVQMDTIVKINRVCYKWRTYNAFGLSSQTGHKGFVAIRVVVHIGFVEVKQTQGLGQTEKGGG